MASAQSQAPLNTTSPQVSVHDLTPDDFASVVKGSTDFGFDLIEVISEADDYDGDNIFISPISISSAFGLAYAGSGTQTASEIARVMNFDLPHDRIHRTLGTLQDKVRDSQKGQIFDMANTIFVDKRLEPEKAYKRLIKDNYGAGEQKADIYNKPEKAVKTVNAWVKEQTRGLIPKTLTTEDMEVNAAGKSLVSSIMINTAYLKADWRSKFSKDLTRFEKFSTPNGPVDLLMMWQEAGFAYYDGNGFKAVDLPYKNNTMAMTVLLPDDKDAAVRLANKLNAKKLGTIFSKLDDQATSFKNIDLKLPKADLSNSYKLEKRLKTMGMKVAFTDRADFHGRFDPVKLQAVNPAYQGEKISKVIHKTVLKMDEDKTEAAAVTAIIGAITVSAVVRPEPIEFHVDRPFVVVLRHKESQAVLFAGVVNNPCPEGGC